MGNGESKKHNESRKHSRKHLLGMSLRKGGKKKRPKGSLIKRKKKQTKLLKTHQSHKSLGKKREKRDKPKEENLSRGEEERPTKAGTSREKDSWCA